MRAPKAALLGLPVLLWALAAPALAQQQCYRAQQQVNVRSQADICSGAKGSILPGDIIQVQGSPDRVCYNWGEGTVVSGNLDGTEGFFNLDALEPVQCPWSGPPPPSPNAPCKNPNEQCWTDDECCQTGSGPPVRCQAPDDRGSPKVCSGGAIVSSITASRPVTGVVVPTATAADGKGR